MFCPKKKSRTSDRWTKKGQVQAKISPPDGSDSDSRSSHRISMGFWMAGWCGSAAAMASSGPGSVRGYVVLDRIKSHKKASAKQTINFLKPS